MPYYLVVTGLPSAVKKQKIVHFLRRFVFKKPPLKFWLESLQPISEHLNEMIIRFDTVVDAEAAMKCLQDYPFQHTDQQIYMLKARMQDSPPPMIKNEFAYDITVERDMNSVERQRPDSPIRDRSPHYREELAKLQLEIELTNKKRLLLEAERNLLMEQKKLEMLQNSGPNDVIAELMAGTSASEQKPSTLGSNETAELKFEPKNKTEVTSQLNNVSTKETSGPNYVPVQLEPTNTELESNISSLGKCEPNAGTSEKTDSKNIEADPTTKQGETPQEGTGVNSQKGKAKRGKEKRERKRPHDQNGGVKMKLYWPCRIIGKEMKYEIRQYIKDEEKPLFNAMLRAILKKRLYDILQGENCNIKNLTRNYRNIYPRHLDVSLILAIKEMIKEGQIPQEFQPPGSTVSHMINNTSIDPADLPISALCEDLDDWTEENE